VWARRSCGDLSCQASRRPEIRLPGKLAQRATVPSRRTQDESVTTSLRELVLAVTALLRKNVVSRTTHVPLRRLFCGMARVEDSFPVRALAVATWLSPPLLRRGRRSVHTQISPSSPSPGGLKALMGKVRGKTSRPALTNERMNAISGPAIGECGHAYGTRGFAGTHTNCTQVLRERPGIPATGSFA
jgi:hypothetical protein